MWKFSRQSETKLAEVHPALQRVMRELIKLMDVKIVTGYRSDADQERMYREGKSQLRAGESKHNVQPARAIDVTPYPYDPEDRERFTYMAGMVRGIAHQMGINLRWGGDWDNDGEVNDNNFDDLFHFELEDS